VVDAEVGEVSPVLPFPVIIAVRIGVRKVGCEKKARVATDEEGRLFDEPLYIIMATGQSGSVYHAAHGLQRVWQRVGDDERGALVVVDMDRLQGKPFLVHDPTHGCHEKRQGGGGAADDGEVTPCRLVSEALELSEGLVGVVGA